MSDIVLAKRIESLLGTPVMSLAGMTGGDLSAVYHVILADGRSLIAKCASRASVEANMLQAIAETGAPAPAVIAVEADLLLMERLAGDGGLRGDCWPDLAHVLARLHAPGTGIYGWPVDHAFGAVAIPNGPSPDWPTFWADRRLRCHLLHMPPSLGCRIEALADRLGEMLPREPTRSLLHGDLWGGNVLVAGGKVTGLIDPACYHGDREVDVAMLTLFDHPPADFPSMIGLDAGWRERLPVYRLWPLLVHLRLFGQGYAGAVAHELDRLGC